MNSSTLYLLAVFAALAVAVITAVVTILLSLRKNKITAAAAPNSKIEGLPYDPISSPEVDNLVDSAYKLWSLEAKLARPHPQLSVFEVSSVKSEVGALRNQLEASDVYYFDPTGQHYSPANYLEVVSVDEGVNLAAHGTSLVIAESPAVVYKDTLVRKAKVNITHK